MARKLNIPKPVIRTSEATYFMTTKTIDDNGRNYTKPTSITRIPNKLKVVSKNKKSGGNSGG